MGWGEVQWGGGCSGVGRCSESVVPCRPAHHLLLLGAWRSQQNFPTVTSFRQTALPRWVWMWSRH